MLLSSKYRRGRENAPCIRAGFRAQVFALHSFSRRPRDSNTGIHPPTVRPRREALAGRGAGWHSRGVATCGPAADEKVTLNFVNADIDAVIKAVAEITGRNFVLDPRVKGTINIVSAKPVPVSLVYPTLLSALRLQGFAAVESDGIVKIVPGSRCQERAAPVAGGAGPAAIAW